LLSSESWKDPDGDDSLGNEDRWERFSVESKGVASEGDQRDPFRVLVADMPGDDGGDGKEAPLTEVQGQREMVSLNLGSVSIPTSLGTGDGGATGVVEDCELAIWVGVNRECRANGSLS